MTTYEIVIHPANGTVVITGDRAVYTPDPGYIGPDSFEYRQMIDGVESVVRRVCLTVEESNFPKDWRPAGGSCEVVNGVITGRMTYTILEEYDTYTGLATGLTKPNSPSDPHYVAPVFDPVACPAATGWRGYQPSATCELDGSGSNTGRKIYADLEQYYLSTGASLGVTKPNDFGDPDWVPPVNDPAMCPTGVTYTASRTSTFFKSDCGPGTIPDPIAFYKSYSSIISQADADNLAATDPNFISEGQAYADLNGSCVVDTGSLYQLYLSIYRSSAPCVQAGEEGRTVAMDETSFDDLSTLTETPIASGLKMYKDLSGSVFADSGWYFGLHSGKSFFVDFGGQVTHYAPCTVAPPAINLTVLDRIGGGYDVGATIGSSLPNDITIVGRVDTNPVSSTPDGADFEVTILAGQTEGFDTTFTLDKLPGMTYHWLYATASPGTFIINKKMPI